MLINLNEPVQALWQVIGDLHRAAMDAQHRQRLEEALAALAAPAVVGVTLWVVEPAHNPLMLRPWLGAGEASARALALQATSVRQTTSADCPPVLAVPLIAWGEVQGALTLQTAQRTPTLLATQRVLEQCAPFLATLLRPPTTDGRDFLFEHLAHELIRARRLHRPLAVLLVQQAVPAWEAGPASAGLDVTGTLLEICRRVDIVGRYDDARCLVILPDTSCRQARRAAERFRARLRRACAWHGYPEGRWDIGIAGFPVDGGTAEELVASAESALSDTNWLDETWVSG